MNKLVSPLGTVFANVDISVPRWSRQNEEQTFPQSLTQVSCTVRNSTWIITRETLCLLDLGNEIMQRTNLWRTQYTGHSRGWKITSGLRVFLHWEQNKCKQMLSLLVSILLCSWLELGQVCYYEHGNVRSNRGFRSESPCQFETHGMGINVSSYFAEALQRWIYGC